MPRFGPCSASLWYIYLFWLPGLQPSFFPLHVQVHGCTYIDEDFSEIRLLLTASYPIDSISLTTLIGLRIGKEFLEPFGVFMAPSIFSSCSRFCSEALEKSLLFWYGAVGTLFGCSYGRIVLAWM